MAHTVGDTGMEQTKLESHLEASADMATGFCVSWCVMLWLIPILFPSYISKSDAGVAFGVVLVFTITSYIRRYYVRRFFARGFHYVVHKMVTRFLAWQK